MSNFSNWDKIYFTANEMEIFKLDKNYMNQDEFEKFLEKYKNTKNGKKIWIKKMKNYEEDNFELSELIGKSFEVKNIDNERLVFENSDAIYTFFHKQDCCEDVRIDDIVGDINDIENSPIIRCEERTQQINSSSYEELLYTFYEFSTIKSSTTIVWKGRSNSFYSVSVNRYKEEKK